MLDVSSGTNKPLFEDDVERYGAALSPDGQFISYVSSKTGVEEIYVTTFPQPSVETVVSAGGGPGGPSWSRDGSELIYRDPRQFHFVSMNGLRVGARERFLDGFFYWGADEHGHYGVHPDGKRFVVLRKNEKLLEPGIHVVLNWFDELQRAAPASR